VKPTYHRHRRAAAWFAALCLAAGCWTSVSPDDDTRGDADGMAESDGDVAAESDVATIETWMTTFVVYAPRGYGTDFTETTDDGIALVGFAMTPDGGFGEGDVWAMKLDAEQNVLWAKVMGGPGHDWAQAIAPAPDGGMVFAAVDRSNYSTSAVWVVQLDRNGSIAAERLMNGSEEEGAMALEPLPDGGYVVGGFVGSTVEESDPWLARLDADLSVVWQRRYDAGVGSIRSIARAANGDLLVAALGIGGSPTSSWVARLDESGRIVWQRLVGGGLSTSSSKGAVAEMTDGDVVVVGTAESRGGAVVLRFDAAGNLRWQRHLGGRWGFSVAPGDSGEAIIGAGAEWFSDTGMTDIWLVALSPDGRIEWQRAIRGDYIEGASVVRRGRDGSILVLSSEMRSWLLKLRPDGTVERPCSMWEVTSAVPMDATLTIEEASFGFEDTTFVPVAGSTSSADVPCPMEWVCPD
jgi:hypothetical protein